MQIKRIILECFNCFNQKDSQSNLNASVQQQTKGEQQSQGNYQKRIKIDLDSPISPFSINSAVEPKKKLKQEWFQNVFYLHNSNLNSEEPLTVYYKSDQIQNHINKNSIQNTPEFQSRSMAKKERSQSENRLGKLDKILKEKQKKQKTASQIKIDKKQDQKHGQKNEKSNNKSQKVLKHSKVTS